MILVRVVEVKVDGGRDGGQWYSFYLDGAGGRVGAGGRIGNGNNNRGGGASSFGFPGNYNGFNV